VHQHPNLEEPYVSVVIGQEAPDFELKNQFGQMVRLSSFRGEKNVLITFFPFAFTGTCTAELCSLRDEHVEFDNGDTVILSISCDTAPTLKEFAAREGFDYSVLSDFWPHGATAKAYGCFNEEIGCALRGSFVIDRDGIVRWAIVNGMGEARSNNDYLKALAEL
jgi:mycoredoxin-dependent peroxiredoxin